MSTASDKTFYSILSDGELKSARDKVLNTVRKLRRCTKVEIMKANGMSHQTVTARLSELMDSGLIKVANTRKGSRSFLSIFSPETNKEQVAVNASIRERARFEKWLKKGEEFKHLINEQVNLNVRLSVFNEVYDKFVECEDDNEFTQYLNENTNCH